MSLLTTVNGRGTLAARPAAAAANEGYIYSASDASLYRSNGASWDTIGGSGIADQGTFTYLDGTVAAAPATPAAGKLRMYAKTGKVLAVKDDAGTETVLGAGGGGSFTALSDSFNRADGAVGNADGGPLQRWLAVNGTWAIATNRLNETSGLTERLIFLYAGYQRGKRTFTWTLNTKPTTGDGGLLFRAAYNGVLLMVNVEATYKLYSYAPSTFTAVAVVSGSPVAPANGDVITVTDDGIRITVSVNAGAQVVYDTTIHGGPFVGFRNSGGAGMTHDSIVITDA